MIDRTAKIKIIQLKDIVIAKRNGISAGAYYCGCDFDVAKTIKGLLIISQWQKILNMHVKLSIEEDLK